MRPNVVRMQEKPWLVVAGGGTAGHVLPALAVAENLSLQGLKPSDVLFVGSRRGIEGRLVSEAGFPIVLLPGRGIQRTVSVGNLKNVVGLLAAFVRAFILLVRNRPAVVFSVGGYASVPCAFSAVLLRIPLVLAESNAKSGVAIRSVARFAKATATAFDTTGLPRTVLVGNPVRSSVIELGRALARSHETIGHAQLQMGEADPQTKSNAQLQMSEADPQTKSNAESQTAGAGDSQTSTNKTSTNKARLSSRHDLGVPDNVPMVAVFGGSLGARQINNVVFELCERWFDRELVVHHVVGDRDFDSANVWFSEFRNTSPANRLDYRQVRYENRMDLVYGAADVVVCRAGATSIADLAIVGMPAILIPLPSATEDHQSANASAVAAEGACIHLPQSELSVDRLATEIDSLLHDPQRRYNMAEAQRRRSRPNAAADVAALLTKFASRPIPTTGATSALSHEAIGHHDS